MLTHSGSSPIRMKTDNVVAQVTTPADRAAILPEWVSAPCEPWQIDPADTYRLAAWLRTRENWLSAIDRRCGSARSANEYARVWSSFYGTAHGYKLAPWAVTTTDAQEWASDLAGDHAPATVNKSLSILASFYRFAADQYDDRSRLWLAPNPFSAEHLRAKVSRFGRSRFPTTDQVLAICSVIDTSSPLGLRDLCIVRGMFSTTRRLAEWINLRWSDVTGNEFVCRQKGGHTVRQVLPDGLRADIEAWLQAAGNWPPDPQHYLFVRLLPRPHWDRPLHPGSVNRMLRHYGQLAGVPPAVCHAHGLRHAGARYRRQHGASAWELQLILGHRNIQTTEIYCREVLDAPVDRLAGTVDALFARTRMLSSRA